MLLDLYLEGDSWAHRLDPRVKLFFVAGCLVLLLVYHNLLFMAAALMLLHLLYWSAGLPGRSYVFIWKSLLPVALLTTILRVLFYPVGQPIAAAGPVAITPLALAQGAALGLRLVAMAFAVFAWLYTTPQPALVWSLVRLRLPYEWGLVLALALRYIPTFQGMFQAISEAQQARGLDLERQRGWRRVRAMMPIFIAMIISALRASQHLAFALESRAFGAPGVRRTSLYERHFRPADAAALILWLLLVAALLALRLGIGAGRHPLLFFAAGGL